MQDHSTARASFLNLSVRGRLLLGFAILTLLLTISIIGILIKIEASDRSANAVIQVDLPIYDVLLDLNANIFQTQAITRGWLLTHEDKFKNDFVLIWTNIDKALTSVDNVIKKWTVKEEKSWSEIKILINQLKLEQINLQNQNSPAKSSILATNEIANKIFDKLDGPLNQSGIRTGGLLTSAYDKLHAGSETILANLSFIRIIEYLFLIMTILLSSFIAFWTAHTIVDPLRKAIHFAKKIATGKRNIDIKVTSQDEIGELLLALKEMLEAIKKSEDKLKQNELDTRSMYDKIVKTAQTFSTHSGKVASGNLKERLKIENEAIMGQLGNDLNSMTDSLSIMTKQITEASHNMVSALEEVRHGVDVQATGASEQASSINQITASLEEIEKSSNQTMEKAKMLGESAARTRDKGQQGLEAVEQSINGMKVVREKVQTIAQTILELSHQTQQVGEITGLVNTLAQQSKMLALNASIEAAKAGEAGKGFAVVAAEVKTLAEQSEQATTQVQKILEEIRRATEKAVMVTEEGTKGVDQGTELVEQTGEIVRNLSEVIHETTIASQQIEAAIRQEGVGIEQITTGMNEINQVTATFVDNVKETTEAIGNLSVVAKNLKEQVDIYKY